jgi:hypothetical protein
MPDAMHLQEGIKGTILYAEQVTPERLDDLRSSEEILEQLEGAVRGEAAADVWNMRVLAD